METYTSWRGVTLGSSETFEMIAAYGSDFGWSVDVAARSRAGLPSLYDGVTPQPLSRDVYIRAGSLAGDYDGWRSSAVALFSPYQGVAELEADFDGDTRTTMALVQTIQQHPQVPMRADALGLLQAKITRFSPYWRSATQSTTSLTVTNDGNAPASPKFTIKPTTGTVLRRRVTFTENTGNGLINHPLQLSVTTTGASATTGSNYYVFDGGNPTLFQAITPNGSSKIYIRKSLKPSSTDEFVDVVYGSAVSNTLANTLLPWGFDWAHASFTNSLWIYRGTTATTLNGVEAPTIWQSSRAPQIPGVWYQTEFGTTFEDSGWTEAVASLALTGNAALAVNTQIKAGATGALNGLTNASLVGWSDLNVMYRLRDGVSYLSGDATVSGGTTLSDIEVDDAVDIVLRAQLGSVTWQEQASSAPISITLDSAEVPTITVDGSATTMAKVRGRLRNTTTGDWIDIDVLIDADASGGLVIDTLADGVEKLHVYPSLSTSPMYAPGGGQGYAFSNPAGLPLAPGANVLAWNAYGTNSGTGDGSPTITTVFSDTWV